MHCMGRALGMCAHVTPCLLSLLSLAWTPISLTFVLIQSISSPKPLHLLKERFRESYNKVYKLHIKCEVSCHNYCTVPQAYQDLELGAKEKAEALSSKGIRLTDHRPFALESTLHFECVRPTPSSLPFFLFPFASH